MQLDLAKSRWFRNTYKLNRTSLTKAESHGFIATENPTGLKISIATPRLLHSN